MKQSKAKLPLLGHLMAASALFLLLFPGACLARLRYEDCGSVLCGNLNISYPFRLKNQPHQCNYHSLELECENNNRTNLIMTQGKFIVEEIFYENHTILVIDAGLDMDDCNSLPLSSVYRFTCELPYTIYNYSYISHYYRSYGYGHLYDDHPPEKSEASFMYVVNCTEPIESSLYIGASRCTIETNTSTLPASYFYFLDEGTLKSDVSQFCTVEAMIPIMVYNISGMSTSSIYKKLSEGVLVSWEDYYTWDFCSNKVSFQHVVKQFLRRYLNSFEHFIFHGPYGPYRFLNANSEMFKATYDHIVEATVGVILLRPFVGILCLLALVMYKWRRRHLSMDDRIEEFLQRQNNLVPIRYSFKEIRKMTSNFKEKLGEGGYGSVFKGKLRSGYRVAVKVLGKKKGDGQDFINEVASIGRIHHANVAKLVVDDSIVSLTAARGTIGYIAPELVYKNLGGISYKADVYSFGMLLMEMVGRRKNVNGFADHTSQVYFPSWIYDRLDQGEDMELGDVSDDEKVMVRKMIITAFWCIQSKPVDRPSMSKILKMLETDVELLEMPPKPFYQLPPETPMEANGCDISDNKPSTSSYTVLVF
ncbi:hypothetical protein V6N11_042211 [Hibiscus sabdariffa]|uniref:Protein kinase domain-containing protein n=1 Tax=Hibiscus sabdariffa TaxID=183260 RepID=A0ABR2QVQ3_9ROSI